MITIQNGLVSLSLDEKWNMVALESMKYHTGNLIHMPTPLFRLILNTGDNWEDVAYAEKAEVEAVAGTDCLTLNVQALNTRMGRHDISMQLRIRLDGEKICFEGDVENNSQSTIVDFMYPCIGGIEKLGGERPGLLMTKCYGEYHTDIIAELQASTLRDGRHELAETYPGYMCMQWTMLMGGGKCMYLTSRDAELHATAFRVISRAQDDVIMELDKMAFVEPGSKWEYPTAVLWLYDGVWQQGAEDYREWANTWRHPITPKKWMQDMAGYFLVINKQQYGDILWPYKDIPQLYELAKAHGFDTLGLFGWYESGHDNMYPDLSVAECMGGEELLRQGIQHVQAQGGHVTLYYQGHLIDVNSPYYKKHGDWVEAKTRWGNPYYEQYNKFTNSEFLHQFTRKVFSTACPYCEQWQDLMAENADWIHSLGADGILYDQIGGRAPTVCFNKAHGHNNISTSYSQGRINLLDRIRKQADTHKDYAFLTENMTDAYAQFIDCVHGTGNYPDAKSGARERALEKKGYMVLKTPGVYRHCFPGDISTIRNWHPYVDPRMANYSFCYGLRLEMELRTLKDLEWLERDEHPEWREYVKATSDLRKKYADLLLKGDYHCDPELMMANPTLNHGLFTAGEEKCIVFWNDTDHEVKLDLVGHSASRWETPTAQGDGVPTSIAPNSLIVLF